MAIDLSGIDIFIKVANFGLTVVVGIYVWISNRNRVTHERITKLEESTAKGIAEIRDIASRGLKELQTEFARDILHLEGDIDRRLEGSGEALARLEEALKQAPNREELRQIHLRINDVSSQVSELEGKFAGAKNTLDLIHEHLLRGAKK